MSALADERIVVPWELDRMARHRMRQFPCLLCGTPLAGGRAVASTTEPMALEGEIRFRPLWVTHHACYLDAFRRALRNAPILSQAPSEEDAHAVFRSALNKRATPTKEQTR